MKQRKTLEREKIVKKREKEKEQIARKLYQKDQQAMERYKARVNAWFNETWRGVL